MFYTYVLYNRVKFYIGFSKNLKKRIEAHYKKKVHTSKRMGKFEMVFYEAFKSEKDARRREKYFKTTKGRKALKLMLRESLSYSGVI